jgi:hypothetical protein
LGSAGTPSIKFTGDLDTGIYSPGANQVAISTNGTGRLFVDSVGNVGINRAAPATLGANYTTFTIRGKDNDFGGGIIFESLDASDSTFLYGDSGAFYVATQDARPVIFATNATEKARLTSAGLLGLGISSPGALLDVSGSGNIVRFGDGTNTFDVRFKGPNNWTVQLDTSADKFNIQRNSSSLVTVDSSGRLGIGTTSPGALLDVAAGIRVNSAGSVTSGFSNGVNVGGYDAIGYDTNDLVLGGYRASQFTALRFYTAATERARIDSSGRLLVGTSSSRVQLGITPGIQSEGTSFNQGTLALTVNSTSQYPLISLARSRGATLNSNTIVANGDIVGKIFFTAADGNDMENAAATIEAVIDGTPGSDDLPGRLVFSVTADGAASPTEAMRIKSTGIINFSNAPTYADNTAATVGGLAVGDVYKTVLGVLMIRY